MSKELSALGGTGIGNSRQGLYCAVWLCSYLRKAGEEEEEGKAENPAMEMSNEPMDSCCAGP